MNSRAEARGASLDSIKLAVAAFLLVIGIFAFYYFSGISTLLRVIGLLVISGAAVAVAFQTERGRLLWQFVSDARMEVRKVVWPTRQETLQTTLVVAVAVLVMGIFFWGLDAILGAVTRALTGQGG